MFNIKLPKYEQHLLPDGPLRSVVDVNPSEADVMAGNRCHNLTGFLSNIVLTLHTGKGNHKKLFELYIFVELTINSSKWHRFSNSHYWPNIWLVTNRSIRNFIESHVKMQDMFRHLSRSLSRSSLNKSEEEKPASLPTGGRLRRDWHRIILKIVKNH